MSEMTEAIDPPPTRADGPPAAARPARPSPVRWRGWLLPLAGLVGGLLLGITLTVVSVIVPRSRELALRQETSPFLRRFSPQTVVRSLHPGKVTWTGQGTELSPRRRQVWGRYAEATLTMTPAEQATFLSALPNRLFREVSQSLGTAWNQQASQSVGPTGRRDHIAVDYEVQGVSGSIHVWAVGRQDELDLIITVSEH